MAEVIERECRWCAKKYEPTFEDQPPFCSAACYEAYNEAQEAAKEASADL